MRLVSKGWLKRAGLLLWQVWQAAALASLLWWHNLANAAANLNPPQPESNEFHFVVLGDAQFNNPAAFNRIVDQTRRLRPAFVIQVGDLIEGYNSNLDIIREEWQRFNRQISPLAPIRYLPVPGNHDLYNSAKQPDARLEQLFEEHWGPLYFSFTYKNALFVGLNSDASTGSNQIAGKQWRWLQRTLADSTAEHKFAFMHRPAWQLRNSEALHSLFLKHGVSHVFYGHHHHYHHLLKDGIHYSMTNASGDAIHDQPALGGFRHLLQVSVRGAEVDVAVIDADAVKPQNYVYAQDNYDVFELKRNLLPASVSLQPQPSQANETERRFGFALPLHNTSRRDVQLFVHCGSADERWEITPRAIAPVLLSSNSKSRLQLVAGYPLQRVPEGNPTCQIRVPLQTGHGAWYDLNLTVIGEVPENPAPHPPPH